MATKQTTMAAIYTVYTVISQLFGRLHEGMVNSSYAGEKKEGGRSRQVTAGKRWAEI